MKLHSLVLLAGLAILSPSMRGQTVATPQRPATTNTIRYGSGSPADSLGVDGDFYIDTTNWILWGPRLNGAWPVGVYLASGSGSGSGGSGIPGPQGPQGPAGTIAIGAVTGLSYGSNPTVTNTGTASAAILNFGIPAGAPGSGGGGGSTVSYSDAEVPGGSINGTNTAFTLANAPSPAASLQLVKNGAVLAAGVDYTLTGTALTFIHSAQPSSGDVLQAWYRYGGTVSSYNYSDAEVPGGSINGSNATFTLAHSPAGASMELVRNGLIQKAGLDFTLSGSTITFLSVSIPATGDLLQAWYRY